MRENKLNSFEMSLSSFAVNPPAPSELSTILTPALTQTCVQTLTN